MNSTFAKILRKLEKKMSENLNNLKEKRNKIQPCAQPTDFLETGRVL